MARHRLKPKKVVKGKQWPAVGFLYVPEGYTPVSHDAERRVGVCGRCGHFWQWHDNVWLPQTEDQVVEIRCRGGYEGVPCHCHEEYTGTLEEGRWSAYSREAPATWPGW